MNKVFIITQSEPFYIPKMIKTLIEKQNSNYEIVAFTVLKPSRKNKSIVHWFSERIKLYSIYETILVGFAFFYVKIHDKLFKKQAKYNSKALFIKNEIQQIDTNDINSSSYISLLKTLGVDYIVSISCPQLFKEEILSIPKKACINAHGTLLPRHRGVFGSWWTLYSEDDLAGSTIHTMEIKLDSGEIVKQHEFKVKNDDTQYSIAFKTKRDMTYLLIDIFNNDIKETLKPKYKSSYHRAPTKELAKDFHRKGKKVITFRDILRIINSKY